MNDKIDGAEKSNGGNVDRPKFMKDLMTFLKSKKNEFKEGKQAEAFNSFMSKMKEGGGGFAKMAKGGEKFNKMANFFKNQKKQKQNN